MNDADATTDDAGALGRDARRPATLQVAVPQSFPVTGGYRGMRLDHFLQAMLPRMSRTAIQDAIGNRVHLASGGPCKPSRRPAVGDVVTIEPRTAGPVPDVVIPVLAKGAGWIVVDKPAGLASTPGARQCGGDVATLLGLPPAHRLDRGTSGCLLLTGDPATARYFDLAFRARRIDKQYVAVVFGSPAHDVFRIDAPLGPDPRSRVPGKVAVIASGAAATTQFEVLARLGERTVLRAQPLTGRRHQIRAHLAHAGHPIVGDLLYGPDERCFIRWKRGRVEETPVGLAPGRHLLHAHRLAFPEPASARRIAIEAPWPADFGGDPDANIVAQPPD